MTPAREFRDELPPVLAAWMDWTERGIAGWSKFPAVAAWVLRAVFLPVMACLLTACALLAIWPIAGLGWVWVSLRGFVKPTAEIVPFRAQRRG